ncbi:MAG: FecR family protein [Zoogloeaceae bacterium]|nr:FecR family protein [Zoogloeaceae bacterium]
MMVSASFLRHGALLFALLATAPLQAAEVGKVAHLVPGATVARNGQTQSLRQDAPVLDSDVIATDATGRVRILFADKTSLSFGGNTRVNLRDFAGAQKTAFSARLLQSAASSASNSIRGRNPGGFGGVRPSSTAGKTGVGASGNPILVNVKGSIGAGLGYAFEFRMNLANGEIFQGRLSDGGNGGGKAYRPDFSGGEGRIDESGWRVDFVDGSVQARDAKGVVTTHRNWKIALSGSDALSALKAMSAKGGSVRVTGFALHDEKGAVLLEYQLAGANASATSGGANGPPKLY